MGFDSRANAKVYTRQEGDTLETIAERERASGANLTADDLARFNFGSTDPDTVNECLRDELGCRKRDANNNFVIAADDQGRSDLLIPLPFQRSGLPVLTTHTLRVKAKTASPQFIECCKVDGITFEFDRSFVRPSVVGQLKGLETAANKSPEAKIMIFGHTDKVGSETYNKDLSERRAKSVFAFITDDTAVWEDLYNRENWGVKVVQEILLALGHDPGPIDGLMGDQTRAAMRSFLGLPEGAAVSNDAAFRAKLFKAYMTGTRDVQLTPDRFMAPKHMGCGEFNPVIDTEAAEEQNRRVMFYLFHKDRLPNLPCKAGDIAPCKKQMTPATPRHFASFKCSFYDSIAHKCACDGPGPTPGPAPATIEIIDENSAVATSVKIGLWDRAFDSSVVAPGGGTATATLRNGVNEPDNFCGSDSRRFHFRVRDPSATTATVNVQWKTLLASRADLDSAGNPLTLTETAAGSKVFVSKGVLLTCDLNDVKQVTNSGLTAPASEAGDRGHTQSNHRTRTGDLEGFVKGEYTPAGGGARVEIELPVFARSPDERRRLPLQIYVIRVANGGAPVISTAAGSQLFTRDLRVIRETYERIGLKVETVVPTGTPAADVHAQDNLSVIEIDPVGRNAAGANVAVANPMNVTDPEEQNLGRLHPMVGRTIRIFFVGGLASGNGGEAAPDVDFAGRADQGTVFTIQTTGPYAAAHEAGHVLQNKGFAQSTGHFVPPAAPPNNLRLAEFQNLLHGQFLGGEAVTGSKRIWDANDSDGVNQFARSRASPYTRPF